MRKPLKFFLICSVLMGCLLSVSLIAGGYFLHTQYAGRLIQNEINRNMPGAVNWQEHTLSLFQGIIEIENLSLKDMAGDDILFLPHLFVKISWRDITRGNLTFDSVMLDRLKVSLRQEKNGRLNLMNSVSGKGQAAEKSAGSGFPLNIKIQKARIRKGEFQYQDNSDNRVFLPNVEVNVQQGNLLKQEAALSVRLSGGEIFFESVQARLDSVQVRTTLVRNQISSLSMDLTTQNGSRINARGRISDLYHTFQPALQVEINGEIEDILKTFSVADEAHGHITASASMKGSLANPSIRLAAKCRAGDAAGIRFDQADIAGHLNNGVVKIERASLRAPFGVLRLRGEVDLQKVLPEGLISDVVDADAAVYRFTGSFHPNQTQPQVNFLKDITGILRSEFEINGKGFTSSVRSGKISLEIFIEQLRKEGVFEISDTFFSTTMDFNLHNIAIPVFTLRIGNNSVSGNGRIDLQSGEMEAVVSSEITWPAREFSVRSIETLQGEVNLTAVISGTLENPIVKGFLKGNDLVYQDFCFGNVKMDYGFSQGTLFIDAAKVQNLRSTLDLSGFVQLMESNRLLEAPRIEAAVRGDEIFLEDFLPQAEGRLAVQGSISGDVLRPEGNVHIEGEGIDVYGQKVKAIKLRMHADKEKLYLDRHQIVLSDGEEIQMNGWVSLYQGQYDLRVFSKGISLNHIDRLSLHDWGPAKLFFTVTGAGSFDNPMCTGEVGVSSLQLNEKQLEPFVAQLSLSDWKLKVHEARETALTAAVNLKTQEVDARARFNRIQLDPWFKLAGLDAFSGFVGADIHVSGRYPSLEEILIQTTLSDMKIFWEQKELLDAEPLTLFLEKGRLRIPNTRLRLAEEGFLDLRGKADIGGAIDVDLEGQLPAKMMEMFSEEISDVKGRCRITASARGLLEKPQIWSTVEFQKVQGKLPYLSEKIREMDGAVLITPELISLKQIRGRFESGQVTLDGSIGLKNYPDLETNLTLNGHAIPVETPDLAALLNADLKLNGKQTENLLSGEVVILEGVYSRNVDLNPINIVTGRSREGEPVKDRKTETFIDEIKLDIEVKNRNPFVIDNNIAILHVKPDFHIQGDMNRPVFTGRAEVESGMITYQKKEFEVTRGRIDFINPYTIESHIELESKTQVREWTISLSIVGVPENLKITVSAEPFLTDGDILSLLVFGKTLQEFIEGEGGQSSSPAELLARLVADRFQDNVKDATGLDSVEMEYQSTGTEADASQVKVKLGKELSRRVAVKYGIETMKGKVVQRAITEYKFLENLMIEAYQDSEGDFGGELQYRLEFR